MEGGNGRPGIDGGQHVVMYVHVGVGGSVWQCGAGVDGRECRDYASVWVLVIPMLMC